MLTTQLTHQAILVAFASTLANAHGTGIPNADFVVCQGINYMDFTNIDVVCRAGNLEVLGTH